MSEYKNYLVTLTPTGNFFFGGRKRSEAEKEKDYYFKSRYFPQQTAVLGMLRQELLMQNQLFPLNNSNREEAARLIGETSFNPDVAKQDFGVIHEISPIIIYKAGCFYHPVPKDTGLSLKQEEKGRLYFNLSKAASGDFIYRLEDYNPKSGTPDYLIASDGSGAKLPYDKVFIDNEQVGIKKGESGQTEEGAFYKQVFLRMTKGFSFSFFLRLKTNHEEKQILLNDNIVFMGGERSAFKMELSAFKMEFEDIGDGSLKELFKKKLSMPRLTEAKIVLYSDAYVENTILNHCRFAVTESVFFRNIRTHVKKTGKFNNLTDGDKEDGKTPFLGKRYNLLKRGSVLYFKENTADFEALKKYLDKPEFQKIGYNYYEIYPFEKGKKEEKE